MLTEEQVYLNIYENERKNRRYKFYRYNLDGNETFDKNDMALYEIDALSTCGEGEWLDLAGLKEYIHIRALDLGCKWHKSVNILQKFSEIEDFRVLDLCDAPIPFDRFRKLYSAEVNYDHKTCQLLFENSSIEFLRLHNYKQRSPESLIKLKTLRELALEQCKMEDLDFLVQLPRLRSFRISYNRNLKSIEGVSKNKNVKGIEIQGCKKIEDWDALSRAYQLEYILLEDCGEIDSLAFLGKLPNLKVFRMVGNTKVKDGRLKSIIEKENMEYAGAPVYKHYDIKLDDFCRFYFRHISLPQAINLYQSGDNEADIENVPPVQNLEQKINTKDSIKKVFRATDFQEELDSIMAGMEEYLEEDDDEENSFPAEYSIKDIQSFKSIISEFLKEVEQSKKVKDKILCITKKTVLKLNQLNHACGDTLIETEQREDIVSLILEAIKVAGVEITDDITFEWREW